MVRRSFFQALGAGAAAAQRPPAERATPYYLLETYYLRNSTQGPRIAEFMSQGLLPAISKFHQGIKVFAEALVAAHMPQYVVLLGVPSLDDLAGMAARLRDDTAYQKALAAWENGPEPPYEHYSRAVLKAAAYPPDAIPEPAAKPRVLELRTYHSPTWKQLAALHRRFADPEVRIFHRSGIHPIVFGETLAGTKMPNLVYVTPFDNLAAREKAWDTFGADPEWIKARADSIAAHGQISSVIDITLLRAATYSPVR
jgi:hypothetical protein